MTTPVVSLVVPVRDEAGNITPLVAEIRTSLDTAGLPWELFLIDDGSTDGSGIEIEALAARRQKRVATDLLTALHALQQKARSKVAQAQVGTDRRQQIRWQFAHAGAHGGQILGSGFGWVHVPQFAGIKKAPCQGARAVQIGSAC
jgi:glycosyltransferase involved in cell wall biosynthesis